MINWRLWLGIILIAFLFFISLFGPEIAPYPVNAAKPHTFVKTKHGMEYTTPPYPPSSRHWLGTDRTGKDILTMLLYGAKYTIFTVILVALVRVFVGGFMGMWAGIGKYAEKRKLSLGVLGSFPAFLIVYYILYGIGPGFYMSSLEMTLTQGVLMVLVGIPGVYSIIQGKTSELNQKPYIDSSLVLGGNKLHLIRKHIFPHLKGNFVILFVNEIIITLGLLGQLGIFGDILGGVLHHSKTGYKGFNPHEWAGMVGFGRPYEFGDKWILFYPLCAVSFAILSFYIFSRGLEKRQRNTQHKVPYI